MMILAREYAVFSQLVSAGLLSRKITVQAAVAADAFLKVIKSLAKKPECLYEGERMAMNQVAEVHQIRCSKTVVHILWMRMCAAIWRFLQSMR